MTEEEKILKDKYSAIYSNTGFSNKYQSITLDPEQRQEQYAAEVMQANTEKANSNSITSNDLEMIARAFIDGLWLNKSEEVGSYVGALAVKVLNPELAQGKSISDIAGEMRTQLEAESAQFFEDNTGLALTANIAGGVLSPVSLAGGKVISEAAKLRQGAQAARAGGEVASRVGPQVASSSDELAQMAQMYGAQQSGKLAEVLSRTPTSGIGGKIAEKAPGVFTPASYAALGAAEGAVIGYEGSTREEALNNSLVSAGISATVPFAFAGVKKIYDFATESKMAQQLGEGADFVNLMFTEHGLAQVYRNVVSKAYGGRTLSEQQARSVMGRAVTPAAARVEGSKIQAEAKRKTKIAKEAINLNKKESLDEINFRIDEKINALKQESKDLVGEQRQKYNDEIAELQEAKLDFNALKVQATKDADEAVNSANAFFRGNVLRQAAPPGATVEEINALGALDPQDANLALDDLWKKYGFKVANGKTYNLSFETAEDFIDEAVSKYPALSLVGGEQAGALSRIKQYLRSTLQSADDGGTIKGSDLIQIRSDIGRFINNLGDNSVDTSKFAGEVQEYFDDLLESGLSKAEKETFANDRAAWAVRSTVNNAISGASGRTAKGGAFTAEDYLEAAKSYSDRLAGRGKLALQREAQEVAEASKTNRENIIALANDQALQIAKDSIKQKSALRKSLDASKAAIEKQRDSEIAELNKQKAKYKGQTEYLAALNTRVADTKERYSIQLADVDSKIMRATEETQALAALIPGTFKGTVFENLFNTALTGEALLTAIPREMPNIKSTLLTGVAGARVLSQEVTQRILARQSQGQASLRRATEAAGRSLEEVGITQATVVPGSAAAVGSVVGSKGLLFSEERKNLIENMPVSGRAALYRNLEAKGQLERLEAEDPKLFRSLKKAYDAAR